MTRKNQDIQGGVIKVDHLPWLVRISYFNATVALGILSSFLIARYSYLLLEDEHSVAIGVEAVVVF